MRKYGIFLILGSLVFMLTGCGQTVVQTTEETSQTIASETVVSETVVEETEATEESESQELETENSEGQTVLFDAADADSIFLTGQEILDGQEADMSVSISEVADITMDFHISRDNPNGVKLYASYNGNAINFASDYMSGEEFDENGEALSNYTYQISCYDFNQDDMKEVVVACGNNTDDLLLYVYEPYVDDSSLFVEYNYILGYTTAYVDEEEQICVESPEGIKPYDYRTQAADPEYAKLSGEIQIYFDYAEEEDLSTYDQANQFTIDEGGSGFLILPKDIITDFAITHVEYNADTEGFDDAEELYSIPELTPEKPLILTFYMPDVAGMKVSYTTVDGIKQSVVVGESGEDGSLFLIEQGEE